VIGALYGTIYGDIAFDAANSPKDIRNLFIT
jgi:hypothetical protein